MIRTVTIMMAALAALVSTGIQAAPITIDFEGESLGAGAPL